LIYLNLSGGSHAIRTHDHRIKSAITDYQPVDFI